MSEEFVEIMEDDEMEVDQVEVPEHKRKVYIPGVSRPLKDDEELDFDPEAYLLFHTFETEKPCLSFDIINDDDGDNRTTYPLSTYLVAGSQCDERRKNELYILRCSNLHGIEKEEEKESDEEDSSSDEDEDDTTNKKKEGPKDPILHSATIEHAGNVNRIRAARLGVSCVAAVWNDFGKVQLWNLTEGLKTVEQMEGGSNTKKLKQIPIYTFDHKDEGFALSWSPLKTGLLASGDNKSLIYIHNMSEGGVWTTNSKPFSDHQHSVEDIQWSNSDDNLLLSCSADRSLRLWDIRARPKDACVCVVENAHDSDVNVISWNPNESYVVSGGDDGILKVWTPRSLQQKMPVATFKHHKGPITSVEWCPNETATFIATGEDDQTTIWDLALETESGESLPDIPPQLLFVHMGQNEVKEAHWHKQIPGLAMTTSLTGFNIFRTISV
uniref:Histone-binding protein RBBP4 N-terminal domain-containing protein n=1 Tax=Panagrolaimus sp. JU765 TaxID=591449 RepID=A0AC34QEX1_9BILA